MIIRQAIFANVAWVMLVLAVTVNAADELQTSETATTTTTTITTATQTDSNIRRTIPRKGAEEDQCKLMEACQVCEPLEAKVEPYCKKTGYKEGLKCASDADEHIIWQTCDRVASVEEHRFTVFEIVNVVVLVCGFGGVVWRRKILDQKVNARLSRQIGV